MFTFELFSCPDGITPNSGLTGPNNIYIYIYIYSLSHKNCLFFVFCFIKHLILIIMELIKEIKIRIHFTFYIPLLTSICAFYFIQCSKLIVIFLHSFFFYIC